MSSYWRSPKGENHGTDSKPGDVWVEVDKYNAGHFEYSLGSTTYQIEVGDGYLRVNEGGDCLFVAEIAEVTTDDTIRALIRTFYIGRQAGEVRGRSYLQYQLRELLAVKH